MLFNPDITKQAQEGIFLIKLQNKIIPVLTHVKITLEWTELKN